jgi:hypothetical protein
MHEGIQTLVERESYYRAIDAEWVRQRIRKLVAFMLFWGASMFGVGVVVVAVTVGLQPGEPAFIASICALGTLVMGAAVYRWSFPDLWRRERTLSDRVYDGDPEFVAPPPPAEEYPFRLPGSLVVTAKAYLGGVLYLGPSGFLFVPNVNHAPEWREPVPIGPVRAITLDTGFVRMPRLARLLGAHVEVLLIRWEEKMVALVVPEPAETQRRMYGLLAEWKFDPPSPRAG